MRSRPNFIIGSLIETGPRVSVVIINHGAAVASSTVTIPVVTKIAKCKTVGKLVALASRGPAMGGTMAPMAATALNNSEPNGPPGHDPGRQDHDPQMRSDKDEDHHNRNNPHDNQGRAQKFSWRERRARCIHPHTPRILSPLPRRGTSHCGSGWSHEHGSSHDRGHSINFQHNNGGYSSNGRSRPTGHNADP